MKLTLNVSETSLGVPIEKVMDDSSKYISCVHEYDTQDKIFLYDWFIHKILACLSWSCGDIGNLG